MKNGDTVTIAPLDAPDKSATGEIIMISSAGSIAVAMGDPPSWAMSHVGGCPLHPEHGFMFLASRKDEGWHELFGGRLFKVEPVVVQ